MIRPARALVLETDGFFALPVVEPVRDETQVKSKHRSAFRRREQLRRNACAQLLAALYDQPRDLREAA